MGDQTLTNNTDLPMQANLTFCGNVNELTFENFDCYFFLLVMIAWTKCVWVYSILCGLNLFSFKGKAE